MPFSAALLGLIEPAEKYIIVLIDYYRYIIVVTVAFI